MVNEALEFVFLNPTPTLEANTSSERTTTMAVLKTYNGYPLWHYLPSTVAAVIFTVLFVLGAAAISWRMWTTRAWYCTAFLIGVLC